FQNFNGVEYFINILFPLNAISGRHCENVVKRKGKKFLKQKKAVNVVKAKLISIVFLVFVLVFLLSYFFRLYSRFPVSSGFQWKPGKFNSRKHRFQCFCRN